MPSSGSISADYAGLMDQPGVKGDESDYEQVTLSSNWLYAGSSIYEPVYADNLGTDEPDDVDPVELGDQLRAADESGIDDPQIMQSAELRKKAMAKAAEAIRETMEKNGVLFKDRGVALPMHTNSPRRA